MPYARARTHVVVVTALLAVALALPGNTFGQPAAARPDPPPSSLLAQGAPTPLPGHLSPLLGQATPLPQVAADGGQSLTFSIVLRRTDEAGFQAFLQGVSDPRSPSYRRFATQPGDLANRFGPSQQAYDAVLGFLTQNGFTLVRGSPDRLMITVQGTRDQINRVLGAQIRNYQWQGRVVFANAAEPSVPAALAPSILAIVGLNNFGRGHRAGGVSATPPGDVDAAPLENVDAAPLDDVDAAPLQDVAAAPLDVPAAQATPTPRPHSISSIEVARAYNAHRVLLPSGTPATGAGQTIGLTEFEAFNGPNLTNWLTSTAGPCKGQSDQSPCVQGFLNRLSITAVGGSANATPTLLPTPLPNDSANQGEVILDIVAIMGVAQGANYAIAQHHNPFDDLNNPAHPFNDALLLMLSQLTQNSTVISSSWSLCEDSATPADTQAFSSVIQEAAGRGVSIFFAINDQGNACNGVISATDETGYPTGNPYVTAVGGSILTVGDRGEYYSETWWGSGNGGPADCTFAFNSNSGAPTSTPTPNPNNWGCGGWGHSSLFFAPPWQIPFLTPSPTPARQVPDVVAYAQPGITVWIGSGLAFDFFGTSLASPLWAGSMALINEARGGLSGALNPTLYQLKDTNAFHGPGAILPLPSVPGGGNDFTHIGLGSPDLGGMAAILAPTPTGTPRPTATRTATATATATIHPLTQTAIALTGTPTPTIHPLTQTAIVQTATVQALTATATPTIHPLTQTAIVQTATVQALTATATPTIHPLTQTAIALTPTATSTPVRAPSGPLAGGTPGVPAATTVGQVIQYSSSGTPNSVSGVWRKTGSGAFAFSATNTSAAIVPGSLPALTLPTTAGPESGAPLAGALAVCSAVGPAPPFTTTCQGTTVGDVLLGAPVAVTFATAGGGTVVSIGQQVAGAAASNLTPAQAQAQALGTAGFVRGTVGLDCAGPLGPPCPVTGAVSGALGGPGGGRFTLTATVPAGVPAGILPLAVFSTDVGVLAASCGAPTGAAASAYTCSGSIGGNALAGSTATLCFTAAAPCLLGTVRGAGPPPPPLLPPPPIFLPPPPAPLIPLPPLSPPGAGPAAPAEVPLIPEADSLLLVGLGLAALGGWALRRRRAGPRA